MTKEIITPVIPMDLLGKEKWFNFYKQTDALFNEWTEGLNFEDIKDNPLLNIVLAKCSQSDLYKNA